MTSKSKLGYLKEKLSEWSKKAYKKIGILDQVRMG